MTRNLCSVDGCDRFCFGRGLCQKHYKRLPDVREKSREANRRWAQSQPGAESARRRRQVNRETAYYRRWRHGLSMAQLDGLLRSQNGRCANHGCAREFSESLPYHVDHDHSCCPSRVSSCGNCMRGLLCRNCNAGMGLLGDSIERLEGAAAYLRRAANTGTV